MRYTNAEASGVAVLVVTTGILEHTNISDAHHARYTDAEAITAASGALNHHARYTDSEASGIAVQVVTTGILEHANISDAHHSRYTDAEAISAASGALEHHVRYSDAEASGIAVQVVTTGILEHTNISDAHHTRYTDAEASGVAEAVFSSGLHELLSETHSDSEIHTVVEGDLIFGSGSSPKWIALPVGGENDVLSISSGIPFWSDELANLNQQV